MTRRATQDPVIEELNGRLVACQLMIAGLLAHVANSASDPLGFITDFRDEMHAVVAGVRIAGGDEETAIRIAARRTLDELFSLMKPPSDDTTRL